MTVQEFIERLRRDHSPEIESTVIFAHAIGALRPNSSVEIPRERVLNFYLWVKEQFQVSVGCRLSNGEEELDELIWEELTKILALIRDVLIKEYGVELPKARVISPVLEAVEAGIFVAKKGKDGQTYVKLNEGERYDMTIRITKVPTGPAPERFRELWVGIELPARRGVTCLDVPHNTPGKDTYVVPKIRAVALMRGKSEEAATWFEENFRGKELLFITDEAEIVS
ncbi:MAG: hypothetical protein HYT13_01970 [Candidatus Liptonbacteria bacterium]|nr:hypothetical protein [Candidatus Liptonbacteria bacterium]